MFSHTQYQYQYVITNYYYSNSFFYMNLKGTGHRDPLHKSEPSEAQKCESWLRVHVLNSYF